MSRVMLDKWAASIDERRAVLAFWEWLTEHSPLEVLRDLHIENALDKYHGINRRVLESERRELVDANAPREAGAVAPSLHADVGGKVDR